MNGARCFGSAGCCCYIFVGCWLLGRLVSPLLALRAVTARKLWAHMARVMCRCQASYFRTWYSSRPTSLLAAPKHSSMGQRAPATVHEFTEPGVTRVVTMVESEFTIVDGSPDHILVVRVVGRYQRPIVDTESFRADAAGPAFPRGVIQFQREVLELDLLGRPSVPEPAVTGAERRPLDENVGHGGLT